MFSPGLVFDDAAVVNYTGYAPFGPDRPTSFFCLLLMHLWTTAFTIQTNTHRGACRDPQPAVGDSRSQTHHTNTQPFVFTTACGK